jgi:hypothetical protein
MDKWYKSNTLRDAEKNLFKNPKKNLFKVIIKKLEIGSSEKPRPKLTGRGFVKNSRLIIANQIIVYIGIFGFDISRDD